MLIRIPRQASLCLWGQVVGLCLWGLVPASGRILSFARRIDAAIRRLAGEGRRVLLNSSRRYFLRYENPSVHISPRPGSALSAVSYSENPRASFARWHRLHSMQWIAPSEKDVGTALLEKRLCGIANQVRASYALNPWEYFLSAPDVQVVSPGTRVSHFRDPVQPTATLSPLQTFF